MTSCSRCESTMFWAPFLVGQSQFAGKRSYLYPGEEMSMGRAIFVCDSVSFTQPLIHWSWLTQLERGLRSCFLKLATLPLPSCRRKREAGEEPQWTTSSEKKHVGMVLSGRAHLSRCSFLVGYLKSLFGRCEYQIPSLGVGCFECFDCRGSKRIRQKSRVTHEHLCFFDSHFLRNS